MQVADVLPQLTILPLRRFADAWAVSTIKSDKRDVFEQAILGELSRIDTEDTVRQRLAAFEREVEYTWRTRADILLRLVLDEPGYVMADEGELIQRAVAADTAFFEYARSGTSTRHLDPRTVDIYQSVLEVAWEDKVTFDEYQLIKRLQRKLNLSQRDHRVMEVGIVGNSPITPQEAVQSLRYLNYYGFICQFKHRGHTQVVLPEEIALHLRSIYGCALQPSAYRNLASKLPISVIKETLEQAGQPSVSLKKDFLIDRLIDGDVAPAALLERLGNDALDELFSNFPDQKRPTMRAVKIRHLIAHFDRFASKLVEPSSEDPDKTYYDYLVELSERQYEVLRVANGSSTIRTLIAPSSEASATPSATCSATPLSSSPAAHTLTAESQRRTGGWSYGTARARSGPTL